MHTRVPEFLQRLQAARSTYRLPRRAQSLAREFIYDVLALLFPHYAPGGRCAPEQTVYDHQRALEWIGRFLAAHPAGAGHAERLTAEFSARLPAIYDAPLEDAQATYDADPAAKSVDEVILAYPGFFALACYRVAHELYAIGVELLPRLVTEVAHRETGIDIHPGARIGHAMSIDHGTGIVIGETTVIGDRVRIYQGVTLGALSVRKHDTEARRHPTIEDDVIIYANATILGGETVVGAGSVIGGNVWLTHSVPPGTLVTEVVSAERRSGAEGGPERPGS